MSNIAMNYDLPPDDQQKWFYDYDIENHPPIPALMQPPPPIPLQSPYLMYPPPFEFDPLQNYVTAPQLQHPGSFNKPVYPQMPPAIVPAPNDVPLDMALSPDILGVSFEDQYPTPPDRPELVRRLRVVRGINSGGSAARPPKPMDGKKVSYVPVKLQLVDAGVRTCCMPEWSSAEKADRRRIIRIERTQDLGKITARFLILGAADHNPRTEPGPVGVDVVEVSCLECFTRPGDDSEDENEHGLGIEDGMKRSFYITSVEVVKIVELLIGTELTHPFERRRERGRIRLNLVPFWLKKPISTRLLLGFKRSPSTSPMENDFRVELARRIMGYSVRKPRGFDKDVRILKWEKLEAALRRALQTYYVEIPE